MLFTHKLSLSKIFTLIFLLCFIINSTTSSNSYLKIKRYRIVTTKKIAEKNYLKYFRDKISRGYNKIKNFLKHKLKKKKTKIDKTDDFDDILMKELKNGKTITVNNKEEFERIKKMLEMQNNNNGKHKRQEFDFGKPNYQNVDFKQNKNKGGETSYISGNGSKWEQTVNAAGLKYLNEFRTKNGRPPLDWEEIVFKYARPHTEKMAKKKKISHDGFDKRFDQISKHIDIYNSAENVAYFMTHEDVTAEETARRLTDQWIKSPGHRANMLLKDISHAGVSILRNEKTGAYYGTQFFVKK